MPRVSALVLVLCALPAAAQERPLPPLEPFLQQVRKHLQTDEDRQSAYMYVETQRRHGLDKNGRPTGSESVKVIESYPGFPGEDRWDRVISENGKPTPPEELAKRDRERQKKAEEFVRKLQDEKERAKMARERAERRRDDEKAVDEIFRVYDIRMLGREPLEHHDTIVFSLTPRPGARPRTREGRIMRNFVAKAWVSESDYELVRLEIEAIDDVSIGLGLLARVHKGTRAWFQRRKVNGEEWLPAEASYTASARVLLLKRYRVGGTSEFSGYRKFTVDTSTTYTRPK
jgi:hypothetical protein